MSGGDYTEVGGLYVVLWELEGVAWVREFEVWGAVHVLHS